MFCADVKTDKGAAHTHETPHLRVDMVVARVCVCGLCVVRKVEVSEELLATRLLG